MKQKKIALLLLVLCCSVGILQPIGQYPYDLYHILGLNQVNDSASARSITEVDIKKAYKEFSKHNHPDKNPTEQDKYTKIFQGGREAYTYLLDSAKKSIYDVSGIYSPSGQAGAEGMEEEKKQAQELLKTLAKALDEYTTKKTAAAWNVVQDAWYNWFKQGKDLSYMFDLGQKQIPAREFASEYITAFKTQPQPQDPDKSDVELLDRAYFAVMKVLEPAQFENKRTDWNTLLGHFEEKYAALSTHPIYQLQEKREDVINTIETNKDDFHLIEESGKEITDLLVNARKIRLIQKIEPLIPDLESMQEGRDRVLRLYETVASNFITLKKNNDALEMVQRGLAKAQDWLAKNLAVDPAKINDLSNNFLNSLNDFTKIIKLTAATGSQKETALNSLLEKTKTIPPISKALRDEIINFYIEVIKKYIEEKNTVKAKEIQHKGLAHLAAWGSSLPVDENIKKKLMEPIKEESFEKLKKQLAELVQKLGLLRQALGRR